MRILAHRGAHHPESPEIRENTVAAFRRAAEIGADGVELDVRRSADGALVVLHDPVVPGGAAVSATNASDLPAWLPTLEGALAACAGLRLVNVEIKNSPVEPGFDPTHAIAKAVAAALDRRPGTLVSCFNLATLDAVHAADAHLPTGWLTGPGWDQAAAVAAAAAGGHSALNPADAAVTDDLVHAAHGAGLELVVWTVDAPSRIAALAAMGVDVLVTDRPALALTTISGRSGP